MPSIAEYRYPRIVWRGGEKRLWNPIHRKALKNRPEERVRLRTIEYLVGAGWSKHRISTEEAIGQIGDTSMRTDIICYTQQFEPRILVECKAEHIPISAKTAEQVARYNHKVGAPFLLMTNGITDFWYGIQNDAQKISRLEKRPDLLPEKSPTTQYDFDDWKNRGFAGSKAVPDLRKWLEELLPALWFPEDQTSVRFLSFSNSLSDLDLNHYYRIHSISENKRLALTTINTPYGGNRLVMILNEQGENRAVLEINMDLVFDEKKGNCSVYSEAGIHTFDIRDDWNLESTTSVASIFERAGELISKSIP
jgi:hypothetical protein